MKKQWTAFLAMLMLSSSMTGCGAKEDVKVPPVQEEPTETAEAGTPVETAASDEKASDEKASDEIKEETDKPGEKETADKEETKKEEVKAEAEKTPSPSTTPAAEKKEETAKAPAANKAPAAKPNANSSSASASTSSTKPSAAPQTPAPSNKPVPSPTPETPVEKPAEKPVTQTSLSCSQLFSNITSGIEFGMMMEANSDLLRDFYNIDSSLLEDYCVKMPQMSFQITEIGVFKVKDANNVSSVVAGIEQRANNVGISLYPSLQETYDSRVILTKGNYILFAMAEDAAAIADQFNSLFK